MNTKKLYEPPMLKVVNFKVEKGFALSTQSLILGGSILDDTEGSDESGVSSDEGIWKWMDRQNEQTRDMLMK